VSPVARRPGGAHTGRAVAVALVGVALALGVAFGVASLASRGEVDVKLGDDRFNAGDTRDVLDDIQERGAPLGLNDVARFRRPIWVDNAGDDPDRGWIAVGAYVPDRPECLVQWVADEDRFVAECDDSITFPRSGAGLRQFPTEVLDGRLYVDLQGGDDD
jgi:hypothetical protein